MKMNTLGLVLVLVLASLVVAAPTSQPTTQPANDYMFCGFKMGGPRGEFEKKLAAADFKVVSNGIWSGTLDGFPVLVRVGSGEETIEMIEVRFSSDNGREMVKCYRSWKRSLSSKYGETPQVIHIKPETLDDDEAAEKSELIATTAWADTRNGYILLGIYKNRPCVLLNYASEKYAQSMKNAGDAEKRKF